jgi:hypothetical protein
MINYFLPPYGKRSNCIHRIVSLRRGGLRLLGSLSLALMATAALSAQPLAREDFNYPRGTTFATTAPGNGWSTGWKANQDLTEKIEDVEIRISANGLSHRALTAKGIRSEGGAFWTTRQGPVEIYRGLETPIAWNVDSTIYLRALVRWNRNHHSGASRLLLSLNGRGTYIGFMGNGEDRDVMNLVVRNQGETVKGDVPYPAGQTYLIVVRIETKHRGDDIISASIFTENQSLPEGEPIDWQISVAKARSDFSEALGIETQVYLPNPLVEVDEILFAQSYQSLLNP